MTQTIIIILINDILKEWISKSTRYSHYSITDSKASMQNIHKWSNLTLLICHFWPKITDHDPFSLFSIYGFISAEIQCLF